MTDNGNGKIVYKCIGCDDTYSVYKTYTVGDTGPAGGSAKTSDYAAKICDDYSAGGKDDWFLPSRDELSLMYDNLCQAGLGGFDWGYISSSELNEFLILDVNFHSGEKSDSTRNNTPKVRPVRAF